MDPAVVLNGMEAIVAAAEQDVDLDGRRSSP
jgi:hypothetical protein